VQRIRVRFAKRGRLRFLSHRDVARAVERAVRRSGVPVSHSHGFSPHPRISWIGAAPTGTASEAEYFEIGLTREMEPAVVRTALDEVLPDGLDILDAVVATPPALADRVDASLWRIALDEVPEAELRAAVEALMAEESLVVDRIMPSGKRQVDVRAALAWATVGEHAPTGLTPETTASGGVCAILTAVVRQTTPAVRPDDVLGALDVVAGLKPPVPAKATRLAQGLLDDSGRLTDPLGPGRVTTRV
jgi:radical SAM-linked protein